MSSAAPERRGADEPTGSDGGRGDPAPAAAVLIPVKAFHHAKLRLAPALGHAARAELARAMATQVVAAAGRLPVAVVCDDDTVAAWATALGAQVIWRPGRGLNGAVTDGVAALAHQGVATVIVAHGDLPHAVDLSWLAPGPAAAGPGGPDGPDRSAGAAGGVVTLVPDRREDGTNVITVPSGAGFTFAYGPGSFARHRIEALRLGLAVRVEHEPRLAWDVDVPADLVAPDWSPVR
jgi:2-phospho-L-lactate guanylyltransferase